VKKILFLVNVDWFFVSHRLPIALAAMQNGYEVHLATAFTDKKEELISYGFIVHDISINRSKINLLGELKTFISIFKKIIEVKPDILHTITIKPVLYGGLVSRFIRIKCCVVAISGLGIVFTAKGWKAVLRRKLVASIYSFALKHKNIRVIFQNLNDKSILLKETKLKPEETVLISGSGVDLSTYASLAPDSGMTVVLMAARLLRDKGVSEFIDAAAILNKRGVPVVFKLAGKPDPENPTSITENQFNVWKASGLVELLGHRTDMPDLLASAHIFVLPSFYGEGFSKALIEAAACGRPVVTTDVPGCRDAIIPNTTGLLVQPKNAESLADAIEKLALDENLRLTMGAAGRALAEENYSIESVVATHLNIYKELMGKAL
jgi:glycosyltransferase involved in cell wall biosynthesis